MISGKLALGGEERKVTSHLGTRPGPRLKAPRPGGKSSMFEDQIYTSTILLDTSVTGMAVDSWTDFVNDSKSSYLLSGKMTFCSYLSNQKTKRPRLSRDVFNNKNTNVHSLFQHLKPTYKRPARKHCFGEPFFFCCTNGRSVTPKVHIFLESHLLAPSGALIAIPTY